MSILVNGSPTEERKSLEVHSCQCSMSIFVPFSGRRFSGLMRNALNTNLFTGFRVGSKGVVISH
jgi:hypothetical protein